MDTTGQPCHEMNAELEPVAQNHTDFAAGRSHRRFQHFTLDFEEQDSHF